MRHLTADMPKPMLQVRGKPVLEHVVCGLVEAGIRELFIVTGYRAEAIEEYFADGSRFGATIQFGRQFVQNGTGKAVELAKEFVGSAPFLLAYGDILVDPGTYEQAIARFGEGSFSGLIAARRGEDIAKGGLLVFDERFLLVRVFEKPTQTQLEELHRTGLITPNTPLWYNAGIYVFQPVLFEFTARLAKSPRDEYELTDALNAMVAAGHRIVGMQVTGPWIDVRDPETLAQLQTDTPQ